MFLYRVLKGIACDDINPLVLTDDCQCLPIHSLVALDKSVCPSKHVHDKCMVQNVCIFWTSFWNWVFVSFAFLSQWFSPLGGLSLSLIAIPLRMWKRATRKNYAFKYEKKLLSLRNSSEWCKTRKTSVKLQRLSRNCKNSINIWHQLTNSPNGIYQKKKTLESRSWCIWRLWHGFFSRKGHWFNSDLSFRQYNIMLQANVAPGKELCTANLPVEK